MWEMSARLTVRKSSLLKFITVSSAVCRAGRANKQFLTENPNLQNNLTVNITLVGVYRDECGRIFRPALRRGGIVLIRRVGSYGAWQACKACFRIPCAGDIPTPEEWLRYLSRFRWNRDVQRAIVHRTIVMRACPYFAVEKIKADGLGARVVPLRGTTISAVSAR